MNCLSRIKDIIESIESAYGSLDMPDYTFTNTRYKHLLHHDIVVELMAKYFLKNDTDLNVDASLHLRIDEGFCQVTLCLSFVKKWAMLFRMKQQTMLYEKVIDCDCVDTTSFERDVIDLVSRHHFCLLSKAEASAKLAITLFNTDIDECRIYHALIADEGIVPSILF